MGSGYVPDCNIGLKPAIGMVFSNLKEGADFYTTYAHHVGFSVRQGPQKLGEGHVALWKSFVCSKQGWREEMRDRKRKWNQKPMRCGCKAMIDFKRKDDGTFQVVRFIETHTHQPHSPSKRQQIMMNR